MRIWIQGPLGFSSGIPLYMTGSTLAAWLVMNGIDPKTIGLFSLVALPYNLKWLWAPFLDRYSLPLLGRRRGWMILFQFLLLISIAALGSTNAPFNVGTAALVAIGVAFFSACQDVVVDAYRTDLLPEHERGKGGAAYVSGYRVAMIVGSTGAWLMAGWVSWQVVYWILAGLMSVGMIAAIIAPELPVVAPPRTLRQAVVKPFSEFFRRPGALVAIAFVMLYKFGDGIAGYMMPALLIQELKFELYDIALLQKFIGISGTIVGAAIGGVVVDRIGIRKGLLYFGLAQALANSGYVILALVGRDYYILVAAITVDNVFNGMGAAAFVAYLMSMCHHKYSASQHALLASATTVVARLVTATSGWIIAGVGWPTFYALSIAVSAPALILWKWLPSGPGSMDGPAKEPRPAGPALRAVAGACAVLFAGMASWKFFEGNWKLGIGLVVPTLAFVAYYSVAGKPPDDDE
jgi:PAT family beta-lactamase induction signal transducer AmpG